MRGNRWAAALISLAFLISCDGGSGGSGGTGALGIITLAADKTAEAGTARVSFELTAQARGREVTTTGEGEFDLSGQRGHMTMTSPQAAGDGKIEMIFEGTTIYMRYPQITEMLPGKEEWVSMDLQAMGESIGFDLKALMQGGNNDPTQSLNYLRGAAGDVETVGEEEVRGVATTHYRATIDLDKVVENAPPEAREALRTSIKVLRSEIDADGIPVDVWIDGDGVARRFSQTIDGVEGLSTSMTMEMYDFGTEIDVEPPPPGQVIDFDELMEQFTKAGQGDSAP